jgi:chromosome partitioning protein
MTADRLAVAAMKGGVGKSTTAVNLATGLASAGWRVLLVDVDPQANTTSMFLGDEEPDVDLYDVVTQRVHVRKAILPTRLHGVDLLPSSLAVARLDSELIAMHRREMKVIEALEDILGDYDAVVSDLPPSLSPLVIATLAAATSFLVPTDASRWGKRGVEVLTSWVDELRQAKVLTADLLGVLLTKVEPNTRISREIRSALRESGLPLFDTYIPKRTGADRMVAGSLVISDDTADPDIAEAYANLTVEVISRINEARERRGKHAKESGA